MKAKYLLDPGRLYFVLGCLYYYLGSGGRKFAPSDIETPTREDVRAIFEQLKGVNLDSYAIDEIDKSEVRETIAKLEAKLIRVGIVKRDAMRKLNLENNGGYKLLESGSRK